MLFERNFLNFYFSTWVPLKQSRLNVQTLHFLAFLGPAAAAADLAGADFAGADFLSTDFLSPDFLSADFLSPLPVFDGAAAAGLAVGFTIFAGRGALTVDACAAFKTLTTFCSSMRKARMMRSRKHLWHKTPPNVRETDLRRRDMRGRSLGRDGVTPFNFSLHWPHRGTVRGFFTYK